MFLEVCLFVFVFVFVFVCSKIMKAVIQKCLKASVSVADEVVSSIGGGLCVLVGIARDDTDTDMDYMVRKILALRLFDDGGDETASKMWSRSVTDMDLSVLCVSQFTLQARLKGNKPDFHQTMSSDASRLFYERFLERMRSAYKPERIHDGRFGAHMTVSIDNDGPVTICLDSRKDNANST